MTKKRVFNSVPHTYVAFVDMLGVADATYKPSMAQLSKGNELEVVAGFVSDLCRIFPGIKAYGFSDAHVLISPSFDDLLLFLSTLFQISGVVRDFRLRAGIEIGNCYDHSVKQPPLNYTALPFLYGDALTGAVKAEGFLKGSRITCGPSLSKCVESGYLPSKGKLKVFLKKTVLTVKEDWVPFENLKGVTKPVISVDKYVYEINWFRTKELRQVFVKLNKKVVPLKLNKKYAIPDKDLIMRRFRTWVDASKDEPFYPQIMLGLLYAFGVLPIEN